jgi:nucleoside-diphosphate-sugar epimerase
MSYSPYGSLKAVGEQYTKALGGLVVKFWNVYGIENDLEKAHVITDFIIKAKKTGVIDMMTDGRESRQFLYADDACSALYELMLRYDEPDRGRELHVTSFKDTKIIEIADYIAIKLNAKVRPGLLKDLVQKDKKNIPDPYIKKFWTPSTKIWDGIDKVMEDML